MSNNPHVPMDDAHLAKYAANAARALVPEGTVPVRALARTIRSDLAAIRSAHAALSDWAAGQSTLPEGVAWLLDNHYLALREGTEALRALRRGRPLRGAGRGDSVLMGCARGAMWAVPDLERDRLSRYLAAFQQVLPLTERELSLFVPALAAMLVCRLQELCSDLEELKSGRVEGEAFSSVFTALRSLSAVNWGPILERASGVEQQLRQDPSGDYADMDEDTRRRYRSQVWRQAKKAGI